MVLGAASRGMSIGVKTMIGTLMAVPIATGKDIAGSLAHLAQPPMPACASASAALSFLAPPPSTWATDLRTALVRVASTVVALPRS